MRGKNAGVLDAMSDVSESSDSDEELLHVMDPSDPRAHRPEPSKVQPTRQTKPKTSRWDSDDDLGEPVAVEDVTPIVVEEDDVAEPQQPKKKVVTLSKWAQARFLVPMSERKLPVMEEPPMEPLNDFILSDFGSRFRGHAGDVEVEKTDVEEVLQEEEGDKMLVGAPLFEEQEKEENEEKKSKKKKDDTRKRKENRYFITDLATKCFHCGEVGHMASVCMNDKLQQPCYYCALRGHQSWECPNLPCANCLQLGHQERECSNRTMDIDPCGICGRAGHIEDDCENVESQEQLTCMVCTTKGHLHCVPVPPPADRRVYCPHCAKNHTLEKCDTYREPTATNFATRTGGGRTVQTCYECNEPGHIAAECPIRLSGHSRGRGNCFKCGKPGHFAANCFNSNGNGTNGRHVTGRKRGRDVYPDPDFGDDYDKDEDCSYYEVVDHYSYDSSSRGGKKSRSRSGSSKSRKSSSSQGYARLNEALPTRPYRDSNSSYGDRRRNNSRR